MIFISFKKLGEMGIARPSLAPEGALFWTKLYKHILEKRDGKFTTIRIKKDWSYKKDMIVPVYLDHKKPNYKFFDAEIRGIKLIRKEDITEQLAKYDADMAVDELRYFLNFFYQKKYGEEPQLQKLSLRRVG